MWLPWQRLVVPKLYHLYVHLHINIIHPCKFEANVVSDARTGAGTDAETGIGVSKTGGLDTVEGADIIVLGVLGMMH